MSVGLAGKPGTALYWRAKVDELSEYVEGYDYSLEREEFARILIEVVRECGGTVVDDLPATFEGETSPWKPREKPEPSPLVDAILTQLATRRSQPRFISPEIFPKVEKL